LADEIAADEGATAPNRVDPHSQTFLTGAGPAVVGASAGSAIRLTPALQHLWPLPVLAIAAVWPLAARRRVLLYLAARGRILHRRAAHRVAEDQARVMAALPGSDELPRTLELLAQALSTPAPSRPNSSTPITIR
jgi:hypothetical protein